jgi:hypothetical protein
MFFLDIYIKNLTLLAGLGAMGTMGVLLDDGKVSHLSYSINRYHSIFQRYLMPSVNPERSPSRPLVFSRSYFRLKIDSLSTFLFME